MHSPDTLQTRINSFLHKLPALTDITALDDNVVRYLVDFEKAVASEVDFLEFRDRLPAKAVDIFVYCISRSKICGVHPRSKPKFEKSHVIAVLLRQEGPPKVPRRTKRGRPRKEVPTPVATSPDSKHSEDDTSSDEESPETARHIPHYPQDDEWSAGSSSSDFGSDDGFAPLLASPSPLHNRAPPIASPENFRVDVSEVDIINLRPTSPITKPIGDNAPISPEFLVVVKLKDAQPYVVSLYDSVPAEENTKVARRRTQRLFGLYLPNATISVNRLFKRMAGPLQSNGHDCGVYVFATALHLIVDENLPSEYHSTIWRKLMAAALSQGGTKPPACDDGSATAYGNWEAQMKKWQDDKRTRMIHKTEQFTQPNEK
ncbi:hypothetical protein K4K59_009629 [Colletotrichum sp. SAR11_240]|nr:hypothetical protein K4K59_009629 [Colletotrichum sp. SAR11_240]